MPCRCRHPADVGFPSRVAALVARFLRQRGVDSGVRAGRSAAATAAAIAEAPGCEAGEVGACDAVLPDPAVWCAPQAATMIAAANKAARPPMVATAVATRCTRAGGSCGGWTGTRYRARRPSGCRPAPIARDHGQPRPGHRPTQSRTVNPGQAHPRQQRPGRCRTLRAARSPLTRRPEVAAARQSGQPARHASSLPAYPLERMFAGIAAPWFTGLVPTQHPRRPGATTCGSLPVAS